MNIRLLLRSVQLSGIVLSTVPALALTPVSSSEMQQVVFESVRVEDADGTIVDSKVVGDLDDAAAQRAARPWSYLNEEFIFDEQSWSRSGPNGTTEFGYRVVRRHNPTPTKPQIVFEPPTVDPRLQEALVAASPGTLLPVTINFRGMPPWNVPVQVEPFTRSEADRARAAAERRAALDARAAQADELTHDVALEIERAGGRVYSRGRNSAWILASVPASLIHSLRGRPTLRELALTDQRALPTVATPLDVVRASSHLDAQSFINAGYNGNQSNPGRHAFGDITVGVIEAVHVFEDEGCFMYDGAGCTGASRIEERFRCDDIDRDGNYCEPTANFRDTDADDNATHGSAVVSTILGDYRQGQGDPYPFDDPAWSAARGHDPAWANARTGIAPEARLIFFGQMSDSEPDLGLTSSAALADAFDDAIDRNVDITNGSWTLGTDCAGLATSAVEQELENAFDDGILAVMSAGNPNSPVCSNSSWTLCTTNTVCTSAGVAGPCSEVCDNDRTISCATDSDCAPVGGDCDGPKVCAGRPGTTCNVDANCSPGGTCRSVSTACNLGRPSSLVKALAVNSLNGAHEPCVANQLDCLADAEYTANGGVDVTINGTTCSGCAAGVDLAAPDRISGVTYPGGDFGDPGGTFDGTSAAAPVVAGAAALVKDWYLAIGNTFVNSPGRLQTVMLSMGDRTNSAWGATQASYGRIAASNIYGLGRLKMRLLANDHGFGPWATALSIHSFTSGTPDIVYFPFAAPLSTGTRMVKCVLYQVEDMSDKQDMSRVDLEIRLRAPVSGACSSSGSVLATRINSGFDPVKYSAFETGDVTLTNRCLEVTLNRDHVTAQGTTAQVFCYSSGLLDREPASN